ncbi:MAG: hypothetical protein Q9218_002189 [Villophora microphyllina]
MKLREVSFNSRTPPPLSSPLAKQRRGPNGNRVTMRSASAEAAKYIEHLESQLVAVNTKLDSLMSPSSHKARAAKLRALTSEARSLRQQLEDWEQKFNDRVKDERNQLAEVEMSLTARLQALEDEVEAKDNRVRDLEWEMENMRVRVKEAEGLENVNTDLERRIELLTTLLVQSPTKLELCSAASSPSKADRRKRTPRPTSMLPRVPQSSCPKRLSLNLGPDVRFRRSRPSITSPLSPSRRSELATAASLRENGLHRADNMQGSKESSDLVSGNSSSFRSPSSASSRPTSLHSSGSLGAHCWGLPLPAEPEGHALGSQKQRRMRRFPSGTASLKPLILPTAAATQSLPASAPVQKSAEDRSRRDFSETSLDPTAAFLSKHDFSSPFATPTQPLRQRSSSYAQREALYALEGQCAFVIDKDDSQTILSPRSSSEEPLETVEEESQDARLSKRERPRSLREDLAQVELLAINPIDDGLIPYSDQSTDPVPGSEVFPSREDGSTTSVSRRHQQPDTPKSAERFETTSRIKTPTTKRGIPSPKSTMSATVAAEHAQGVFCRLTSLVSRTKQGPSALAHRLIRSAWAIGIDRLGGLGWWLLGLIYWSRRRKKKRTADAETIVEEIPSPSLQRRPPLLGVNGPRAAQHSDRMHARIDGTQYPITTNHYDIPRSLTPSTRSRISEVTFDSRHQPHLIPCPDCQEPSSRRSFRLWFRFSLAIILAVGIAIKDGPGVLLGGCQASGETLYNTQRLTPQTVDETSGARRERTPHRVAPETH